MLCLISLTDNILQNYSIIYHNQDIDIDTGKTQKFHHHKD